ncbi:hypothetical protein SAMN05216600_11483 [Pseudomonas cuatrocienegasensis]|uniref:Flp pilus assembly protein TadG n=1 Tax=Pseudomonas cuatrocienegasensis TaxID=543360 RepID=A0ABY1BKU0_9PSED|nr:MULTISPECIES: hypothetical protein [Pseudomonas]OEC34802.1 hypothetical protein A7D25_11895 [Pseudomonas sp. 21C1]SER06436.1 hypothetical protein SAMN05216600_11483 [Pseudomonas cuatrocienegasensis]
MIASPRTQRGNALVETALILPLLIGSAIIIADLYNINQARAYMEQSAHTVASTLAMQSRLDKDSLQALTEQSAAPGVLGDYEMVISRVMLDRSMPWKPLYRGNVEGICAQLYTDGQYNGELPEEAPATEDDEAPPSTSLVVVQLCRNSDNLALSSALIAEKDIQTISFARMSYNSIELDDPLSEEVGIKDDDG